MNIEFIGYRRVRFYNPTVVKGGGVYHFTTTENQTIKKIYDVTLAEIASVEDPQLVPGRDSVKVLGEWMTIDGVGYDIEKGVKIYRVDYMAEDTASEDPMAKAELEILKARNRCFANQL